jgi:hypothetical protein
MEQDAEDFSKLEKFGVGKERKGALRLLYKFQQMAKDTRISPGHSTYAVIVFFGVLQTDSKYTSFLH